MSLTLSLYSIMLIDITPSFVSACVRYSARLCVSKNVLISLEAIHESYGKLGIIVNDIQSFDKELRLWNKEHKEGAKLLNLVNHMSLDAGVSHSSAKRILWVLCREWEIEHQEIVTKTVSSEAGANQIIVKYLKGLEYVLGGNEYWSETTERYHWRD